MSPTQTAPMDLDAATRMITASSTYDWLLDATAHYVPTLRADAYRGKRQAACLMLRRALTENGRRVWPEFGYFKAEQDADRYEARLAMDRS